MVTVRKPAGVPITCGMAKACRLSAKQSTVAAAMAGRSNGRVTVHSTAAGLAPEARAARTRLGSARALRPAATTRYVSGTAPTVSAAHTPTAELTPDHGRSARTSVKPPIPYASVQLKPST